jgi:hypothetical protein
MKKVKLVRADLYITEKQYNFLEDYVKVRAISKSHIMREALDMWIKKNKNK